jgi:hypothetical protein
MSEEHKEQKHKHFKMNKLVILMVAVLILAAAAVYFGYSYVPVAAARNQAPTSNELTKFTTTGTEMIASEATHSLPYFESATLEAGRYSVEVSSGIPVWIRVYDQTQFDSWQNTKSNGSTKAGTNLGESDKVTQFSKNFDVNNGEEGKYYLLILGSGQSSLQLKITQISKFG